MSVAPQQLTGEEIRAQLDALIHLEDGDEFDKYGVEHN
jgi:hypothetical protein